MKNKKIRIWITLILLIIAVLYIIFESQENKSVDKISTHSSISIKLPTFADYPAKDIISGSTSTLPAIDLNSNPNGTTFKTRIRESENDLPNFSGKYSVVIWGCGTSCQVGVIIDRNSGKILDALPFVSENGIEMEATSSLIIVNPYIPGFDSQRQELPISTQTTHFKMEWESLSVNRFLSYN